jgi:hypothetical protein
MHENSDDLIDIVAADFLRMRGTSAFAYLNERAEIAIAVSGDIESAIAWWEIAITTIELSQIRR